MCVCVCVCACVCVCVYTCIRVYVCAYGNRPLDATAFSTEREYTVPDCKVPPTRALPTQYPCTGTDMNTNTRSTSAYEYKFTSISISARQSGAARHITISMSMSIATRARARTHALSLCLTHTNAAHAGTPNTDTHIISLELGLTLRSHLDQGLVLAKILKNQYTSDGCDLLSLSRSLSRACVPAASCVCERARHARRGVLGASRPGAAFSQPPQPPQPPQS